MSLGRYNQKGDMIEAYRVHGREEKWIQKICHIAWKEDMNFQFYG
jgi:hypothetical protein